jgi:hypothetical protein
MGAYRGNWVGDDDFLLGHRMNRVILTNLKKSIL